MYKNLLFFYTLFFGLIEIAKSQLVQSNLPILKITTNSPILNEPKVAGQLEIFYIPNQNNAITDKPAAKYTIGIEYRGSTSNDLSEKKPFGFETRTEKGENLNVSLLGLPAENDWILISPYSDKSLVRDHMSYTLARAMNRYASRTRFAEVVVNGQYHGVCILAEKIKQGKNRVDIAKLKETDTSGDDLTGGYILKIDKFTGSPSRSWNSAYFAGNKPHTIQIEYPKIDVIKEAQFNYIRKTVNDFEAALQSPDFRDLEKGYSKFIDIDSFVDYFLLNELTRNVDGYRLSTYFYKDKDSKNKKIIMGPAWDYNLAFGNANYCDGAKITGWAHRFNDVCPTDGAGGVPFWWNRLLQDQNFQVRLKSRWAELRKGNLSNTKINYQIDSSVTLLKDAQVRNFQRWQIMGKWIWPNVHFTGNYDDEIKWMKQWVADRLNWMDNSDLLNPTVLSEESVQKDLERPVIYPNPVSNDSKLYFGLTKRQFVEAKILNSSGKIAKIICRQELNIGEYSFELSTLKLTPGLYIFTLEKDHKLASFQKIIVN